MLLAIHSSPDGVPADGIGVHGAPCFCHHQILDRDGSVRGQSWGRHISCEAHERAAMCGAIRFVIGKSYRRFVVSRSNLIGMRGAPRSCHHKILERNGSVRGQFCGRHMPLSWHRPAASPAKPIKAIK